MPLLICDAQCIYVRYLSISNDFQKKKHVNMLGNWQSRDDRWQKLSNKRQCGDIICKQKKKYNSTLGEIDTE